MAMHTGIQSADLNMVWNEKPLTACDSGDIRSVKKYFHKIGLPFWWWIFPSTLSPGSADMLNQEGFSFIVRVPSMLADLNSLAVQENNHRLEIRQITVKRELALWEEISFAGFDFPAETRQQYHRFVQTFNIGPSSPQKFFVAMLNGQPASTALLFLHKRAGGIYFISTLPEQRKKGVGLAITLAAMHYAKLAGARFVSLQSSPDGFHVYEHAGFKEYCRADIYSLTP